MADVYIIKKETLTDIADAIREVSNITDTITATAMPDYIALLTDPASVSA